LIDRILLMACAGVLLFDGTVDFSKDVVMVYYMLVDSWFEE
jgi:hypothetical protein